MTLLKFPCSNMKSELGVVVWAYRLDMGSGGSGVQDHPQLYSEFKATLSCSMRLIFKSKKKEIDLAKQNK